MQVRFWKWAKFYTTIASSVGAGGWGGWGGGSTADWTVDCWWWTRAGVEKQTGSGRDASLPTQRCTEVERGCWRTHFCRALWAGGGGLLNQAPPLMNSHESPYQHRHGYADVTAAPRMWRGNRNWPNGAASSSSSHLHQQLGPSRGGSRPCAGTRQACSREGWKSGTAQTSSGWLNLREGRECVSRERWKIWIKLGLIAPARMASTNATRAQVRQEGRWKVLTRC